MKVVTVVGARPQFIKAAPVSRELRSRGAVEVLVHTGQHYDSNMSDVFFEELEMAPPAHQLGVGSGGHGEQTGRMLAGIEEILLRERPEWVLVYGDTNSTLAGALAAVKLHLPVAHVEAGLRSFNRRMPEEVNRVLTDHASDLLFAPTEAAVSNLAAEGIGGEKVRLVGDVMYDAALRYAGKARSGRDLLPELGVEEGGFVLATIHRAENTDDPARLAALAGALSAVAAEGTPVVLPLHPRTRAALLREGLLERLRGGVRVLEPVGYLDMAFLTSKAALVATDSGGLQKEAFFHRTPCITLRDETEWVELVELGWNRVAPVGDAEEVAAALREALARGAGPPPPESTYGGGRAAERIADALLRGGR